MMAKRKPTLKKTRGTRTAAASRIAAAMRGKPPIDPLVSISARHERSHAPGSVSQEGASGSFSNNAIASMPPGQPVPATKPEQILGIKIARAMLSGPRNITRDATVAEMDADGDLVILRRGTNNWVCFPGDENQIGNPPMCADPMGLQWMMDLIAKRPRPTNRAPGLIYMLCGASQHSTTDPFDRTSPAIPIGPHWMIIWPFDAKQSGLPTSVRDAGAWVMFDGTPYAYLHICGTPWTGNVYDEGSEPVWTMAYGPRIDC
ncbi:hypothetical protein [Paenibacillus glycinis]|uniref:Uncharacterized protein n=1 Tax=Paenibacillus glycinis TaxID=2697035 RepID=A0ABW9XRA8_9BACL|nr:hypothetical protein [Paenibacillus glycinis]NBD24941.1 hypothetical protein [Paenibacillus glycinis]